MHTWSAMLQNNGLRGIALGLLFLAASGVFTWVLVNISTNHQRSRRERVEGAANELFQRVLAITRERGNTRISAALRLAIADALESRKNLAESSLYVTNEAGVANVERRAREAVATLNEAAERQLTVAELNAEADRLDRQLHDLLANHAQELVRLKSAHGRAVNRLTENMEHKRDQIDAFLAQIAQEKASLTEIDASGGA